MKILEFPTYLATRRNHALEHATIHVLARKYADKNLAGHSNPTGFFLFGDMSTEEIRTAVNEGDLAKHPDKEKFQKMLDAKVTGDRAVVDVDQANLKASAGLLGPLAVKANAKVARASSETHLKQIVTAIRNYSDESNGRMPKSLEDPQLLKYLGQTAAQQKEVLTNPLDPGRGLGYLYVRPAGGNRPLVPQTVILVYEAYEKWPAGGIQAGFADGHVAEIKTEAELKEKR